MLFQYQYAKDQSGKQDDSDGERCERGFHHAGIMCGTGNGNYDPDAPLTWAHIITVMSRFVEQQDYQLQNIQYDGWAIDAVETAVALGWIADHAAFNPDAPISRGELAYFVNFVLGLYR